ncbi:hypothetical protein ACHAW6_005518 [Cyclotella cf. meneghiniana]
MPIHHVNASDVEIFDTLGVSDIIQSGTVQSNLGSLNNSYWRPKQNGSDANIRTRPESLDNGTPEGHRNHALTSFAGTSHSNVVNCGRNSGSSRSRGLRNSLRNIQETNDSHASEGRHSFASVASSHSASLNYGRNAISSKCQRPIYEDVDDTQSSEPLKFLSEYDTSHKQNGNGQACISEEDDTQSLSTMEDSFSVANQQQQYHPPYAYSTSRLSFQHNQTISQQPQRNVTQNHRQNNTLRQSRLKSEGDSASVNSFVCQHQEGTYSSQLESRVTKLSLELATTKTSLDELHFEHRLLHDENEKLKTTVSLLEEENEQLHRMIEKLEKEKLLMNMEKTVGVGRSAEGLRSSFLCHSVESRREEDIEIAVSTFRAEPRGGFKKKSVRRKSKAGDDLEVPFRSDSSETPPKRRNSGSSDADFSVSDAGDALSVAMSIQSTADIEEMAKLMAGGTSSSRKSKCESEDYDESDPFATWSAPEERAKHNTQKNWFRRGVEALNHQQKVNGDSDEFGGDPFDTCSKSADQIDQLFSDDKLQPSHQERKGGGFQLFRGFRGNRGSK